MMSIGALDQATANKMSSYFGKTFSLLWLQQTNECLMVDRCTELLFAPTEPIYW
jgi:hypothetical protein